MPINDRWGWSSDAAKSTDRYTGKPSGGAEHQATSSSGTSAYTGTHAKKNISAARGYGTQGGSSRSEKKEDCYASSDCGSGYACIGNECVLTGSGSSNGGGSLSSCGQDSGGGPCGGLNSGDCTSGNCGDGGINPWNDNCCGGERCCRKDSSGVLTCRCGPCNPPPPACSQYCTTAYNAFGRRVGNCSETFTCDECEECASTGSYSPRECRPLDTNEGFTPCYCSENPEPPFPCYKCNEFGGWMNDCKNCKTTYTVEAACGCAKVTQTCSFPGCYNEGDKNSCETQALANCYKQCDPENPPGDPCAGDCRTVTTCDPEPTPPCPSGSSCRTSGTITVGDQTCTLTEICDKNNVPPECEDCDCHCSNDCPDCQLCGVDGECYPDPACDDREIYLILSFSNPEYRIGNDLCNAPGLFYTYEGCSCYDSLDNPGCMSGGVAVGGKYTTVAAQVTEYKLSFTLGQDDSFYFSSVQTGGTMNTTYCRSTLYGDYVTWYALANTRHVLLINGNEYNDGWNAGGNPSVCKQATGGETERVPVTFNWRAVTEEEYLASDAAYSRPG